MKERSDRESEIRVLKGEAIELMGKVEMDKEQLRKVCECEEVNRLKKESNMEIVIGRLKSENDRLVKEIVGVNKEMIGLEKTIDGLNRAIEHLLSEKNEMEIVQIGEIEELERKSDKFNETVQNLTKEDKVLRDRVGKES